MLLRIGVVPLFRSTPPLASPRTQHDASSQLSIIPISHQVCDRVIHFHDLRLDTYPGGMKEFREKNPDVVLPSRVWAPETRNSHVYERACVLWRVPCYDRSARNGEGRTPDNFFVALCCCPPQDAACAAPTDSVSAASMAPSEEALRIGAPPRIPDPICSGGLLLLSRCYRPPPLPPLRTQPPAAEQPNSPAVCETGH